MGYAIEFQDVTKTFRGAGRPAADHVDFAADEGEFITILGSSGCGKTTLLKMVNRLYEPDSGKITLFGTDISTMDVVKVRRRIGYVIQQIGLFPHFTVGENIAIVPRLLKWEKEKVDARVEELLELIGLEPEEYKNRYPAQLSGGEQQRVAIARALAKNPKLLLCDEPTGALDYNTGKAILKLLQDTCREKGMTVIVITHNQAIAPMADRVIQIKNGRVSRMKQNEAPVPVETIEW